MRRLGTNKVYRAYSERYAPLSLRQRAQCARRIDWKTKGADQRAKRVVRYLMSSTERIRITHLDAETLGEPPNRGTFVHLTAGLAGEERKLR
jgi:hypothetical protein